MSRGRAGVLLLGGACLVGCEVVAGIETLNVVDGGAASSTGGSDSMTSDAVVSSGSGSGGVTSSGGSSGTGSSGGSSGGGADGALEDGPAYEGGGPGEASAGDAADAGVQQADGGRPDAGFCGSLEPAPTFCQDFDEYALPSVWTESAVNGVLSLSTASAVSSPKSLLAQDDALDSGSLNTALRYEFNSLPSPPTTFTLDFQIQPVSVDTSPSAVLVAASLDFTDGPGNRYTVQFTLFQQGISGMLGVRFEEQAGFVDGGTFYKSHPLAAPLTVGSWTEMIVRVDRTGPTTATATIDDGTAMITTPLTMGVNATSLQLTIGSAYESVPSAGWKTLYDNVIVNIK